MTSQLPRFRCLFLSCQQQKNTKNGAVVTSLRSFLFHDDFRIISRARSDNLAEQFITRPYVLEWKIQPDFTWGKTIQYASVCWVLDCFAQQVKRLGFSIHHLACTASLFLPELCQTRMKNPKWFHFNLVWHCRRSFWLF